MSNIFPLYSPRFMYGYNPLSFISPPTQTFYYRICLNLSRWEDCLVIHLLLKEY